MGLFKKKSKLDKLNDKYEKLLRQTHKMSTINRTKSDELTAEAQEILKEIESLEK
ncbi:MAG: Lacal_2735 family protein [Brumimicrobium sp.]